MFSVFRSRVRGNVCTSQIDLNNWAHDLDPSTADKELALSARRKLPAVHLDTQMAKILREELSPTGHNVPLLKDRYITEVAKILEGKKTPPPTPPHQESTQLPLVAF